MLCVFVSLKKKKKKTYMCVWLHCISIFFGGRQGIQTYFFDVGRCIITSITSSCIMIITSITSSCIIMMQLRIIQGRMLPVLILSYFFWLGLVIIVSFLIQLYFPTIYNLCRFRKIFLDATVKKLLDSGALVCN